MSQNVDGRDRLVVNHAHKYRDAGGAAMPRGHVIAFLVERELVQGERGGLRYSVVLLAAGGVRLEVWDGLYGFDEDARGRAEASFARNQFAGDVWGSPALVQEIPTPRNG